jgi:hypothetical protein
MIGNHTTAEVEAQANLIIASFAKARSRHAPMRGPHEGYAVMLEEFDELWDEIKKWQPERGVQPEMCKEALHVAAMALAFVVEVCDGK